jgi:hypothetical protein
MLNRTFSFLRAFCGVPFVKGVAALISLNLVVYKCCDLITAVNVFTFVDAPPSTRESGVAKRGRAGDEFTPAV